MRALPAGIETASERGRARAFAGARAVLVLVTAALAAPACKLNQQGVAPPRDRIAFPASALVDPDGRWLYVANSNSDLRYNNGTLVAVDLHAVTRDRFGDAAAHVPAPTWQVCQGPDRVRVASDPDPCCWDLLDHTILNCDERLYIPAASTVEIGSFSAGMVFEPFKDAAGACSLVTPGDKCKDLASPPTRHGCNLCETCPGDDVAGRLFLGVRGNSSLTYLYTKRVTDADPAIGTRPDFSCPNAELAGDDPRVCQIQSTKMDSDFGPASQATPVLVPDEPYALALDTERDLLFVGNLHGDTAHPQTGGISLFDIARPSAKADDAPVFIGPSQAFFNPDGNGSFGITSLTKDGDKLYASSRFTTNVVNVVPQVAPADLCHVQSLMPGGISVVAGSDVYTTPLVGAEIRGITFMPEGNRAFALQRVPPALVGFDISRPPDPYGNFPTDVLETCAGPTFLQRFDAGDGARLYVTCFDQGQIYVFDPYVPRLLTIINAGRGPAGIAFPQEPAKGNGNNGTDGTTKAGPVLAYIVGFSANDIPVLDLTPDAETRYRIVQRIGFPSPEPR